MYDGLPSRTARERRLGFELPLLTEGDLLRSLCAREQRRPPALDHSPLTGGFHTLLRQPRPRYGWAMTIPPDAPDS